VEQDKAQGKKTEIKTEVGVSSRKQQNQTVRFGKLEHLISLWQVQKGNSRTTAPEIAPTHRCYPLGLTPSQRRRIQRTRAQKLREEATEKERDEHFNAIRPIIPMKQ
jgi:hypothetical protein